MTRSYYFYWNGPFSQWHPSKLIVDGINYSCAEQYMMHQKAVIFGDEEIADKILNTDDPAKQKALGKKVKEYEEHIWRTQREPVVYKGNLSKFDQNKGLRRKLFQTGSALLVEASPLDAIWGIGLSEDNAKLISPEDWPGQNLLGKIITEVREELRLKYPEEGKAVSTCEDLWCFEGEAAL